MILTVMMSLNAFAYDVPKDAIIKVYNKNGKQIGLMSRAKYKVVLIEEHAPCQPVASEAQQAAEPKVAVKEESKNEVIVHGGVGLTGMTTTYSKGLFSVTEDSGLVGGLTYCRNLDSLGLCGSVLTNKTALFGVKFGF